MTPKRSSRKQSGPSLKPGELGQQGLLKRGECKVWGCVYNTPATGQTKGSIPGVLLWPTNTIDPEDRCVFHRLSDQMQDAMARKPYKEAGDAEKKEAKLQDAAQAYYETWLDVLYKYLQEGLLLPRFETYVEQWITSHASDLVAAGPDEAIALPGPPTQGWDYLLILEPDTSHDAVAGSQATRRTSRSSATSTRTSNAPCGAVSSSRLAKEAARVPPGSASVADRPNEIQRRDSGSNKRIKRMHRVIDSSEEEGEILETMSIPQRPDASASEASQRQGKTIGAPTAAEELYLRLRILEERRKYFRNQALSHEMNATELTENGTAQRKEIEKQLAHSKAAGDLSNWIQAWQSELQQQIISLSLDQANTAKLAQTSPSNGGEFDQLSMHNANTSHPSQGGGKTEVRNPKGLDETGVEALYDLKENQSTSKNHPVA